MLIMNDSECATGMYDWIKINTFNLRTPICKVACSKFPCIRTVTSLILEEISKWRTFLLQGGI